MRVTRLVSSRYPLVIRAARFPTAIAWLLVTVLIRDFGRRRFDRKDHRHSSLVVEIIRLSPAVTGLVPVAIPVLRGDVR